jgi:PAS domain S-box-containing protein
MPVSSLWNWRGRREKPAAASCDGQSQGCPVSVFIQDANGQLIYENNSPKLGGLQAIREVTLPTGERREYLTVKFPFQIAEREGYLGSIALDVTGMHAEHAKLQVSEDFNRSILQSSRDSIQVLDLAGRIVSINEAGLALMHFPDLGYALGAAWQGFWSPDAYEEVLQALKDARSGNTVQFEGCCATFTGEARWWNVVVSPITDGTGTPVRLLAISRDITERKRAEEQLKNSLTEKEALLKEVHHRVKNNLQVICSLLSMQSALLDDPQTVAALRNSEDRVQSMAMIHELLCASKTLADIDFSEYAERLLRELSLSYGLDSSRVIIESEIAPVRFGVDRAIPCGLILNELISNALKYAFPNDGAGSIRVVLEYSGADQVRLTVADDGVGMPSGFAMEKARSLGLRIVQILTRQLEGTLHVHSDTGTRFAVTFPAN